MNKEQIEQLLEKYYKAETTIEEEALLKEQMNDFEDFSEENEVFDFYKEEAFVPEGLEDKILENISEKEDRRKIRRVRFMQITSVAAVLALFFSIFVLKPKAPAKQELSVDKQFLMLELALSEVSNSLQPAESDDVVVVFQDENVELVMN